MQYLSCHVSFARILRILAQRSLQRAGANRLRVYLFLKITIVRWCSVLQVQLDCCDLCRCGAETECSYSAWDGHWRYMYSTLSPVLVLLRVLVRLGSTTDRYACAQCSFLYLLRCSCKKAVVFGECTSAGAIESLQFLFVFMGVAIPPNVHDWLDSSYCLPCAGWQQ